MKQKSVVSLCILFAVVLVFSACGKKGSDSVFGRTTEENPGVDPSTDAPSAEDFYVVDMNSPSSDRFRALMCETDNAFYFVRTGKSVRGDLTSQVYFCDKDLKTWLPLCGKPECMHRGSDCNAMLEGYTYGKIWLYGTNIYYVVSPEDPEHPELWRMALDGSSHEKLLSMSFPEVDKHPTKSVDFAFHNKYLLLFFSVGYSAGSADSYPSYIVDLSLDELKAEPLDVATEDGKPLYIGTCFAGKGSLVFHTDPNEPTALYRTDLDTRISTKLCVLPFRPASFSCSLEGDFMYFCNTSAVTQIVSADVRSGEMRIVNTAERRSERWFTPYSGYIFGIRHMLSYDENMELLEVTGTDIYDLSGNLVVNIPYDAYNENISIMAFLGDYVFGFDYELMLDKTTKLPTWYLDLRDIGTENLMWRRIGE